MLTRNPALSDPFLVLEKETSFGAYARRYGDDLAHHYEQGGVIVLPFFPVRLDVEFLYSLDIPKPLKKMGTANGIEEPVIRRQGNAYSLDEEHLFLRLFGAQNSGIASYFQSQVALTNWQIRLGLVTLFPQYHSLAEGNITWRLTKTGAEGLHFDVFKEGAALTEDEKKYHRIKLFFNIDKAPRLWRISWHMRELMKERRAHLPDALPDDINVASWAFDKLGILKDAPCHEASFPPFSAWLVNSEARAHEVLSGHRMIAAEYHCLKEDMLDPALHTHDRMKNWITENNLHIAPDTAAFAAPYKTLQGSYEKLQGLVKAG